MTRLLRIVLLLGLLPNVHAAGLYSDVIEKIRIAGSDSPVEFTNGYNLDRCLELDRDRNAVVEMSSGKCDGLRKHAAQDNRIRQQHEDAIRPQVEEQRIEHERLKQQAEDSRKLREKAQEEQELKRQQELAQKEQERAQREQAYLKEQERIAQLKTCEATQSYRLYAAQEAVIEDIETQQNLKKAVARQKQLVSMSGVRRLDEERQIAEEQLAVKEALKEHWAEYKSGGGKAASPQAVKHKIEDPCDSFRPEES